MKITADMNFVCQKAAWRVNKTEAIDPASDFWWVDDDPTE